MEPRDRASPAPPSRAPPTREGSAPGRARLEAEADEVARRVAYGGGGDARRETGRLLGRDLSSVPFRTDSPAADAEGAHAFAQGGEVHFAPGRHRPDHPLGRWLIAHEVAHVAQQEDAPAFAPDALAGHDAAHLAVTPAGPLRGARLREASDCCEGKKTTAPKPPPHVPDPKAYSTFQAWMEAIHPYVDKAGSSGYTTEDVSKYAPQEIRDQLSGADCADVALLLRHVWLKAHGKSSTFKVGPKKETAKDFTIGKGGDIKTCMVGMGTWQFQEDRPGGFRLVDFYKDGGKRITNLKKLLDAGLKPGDVLVWIKRPEVTGNFQGHAQTVQKIDRAAGTLTVLQGTMSQGAAVGELQQRILTFKVLTGKDDGDAEIVDWPPGSPEESFFGAGPWVE